MNQNLKELVNEFKKINNKSYIKGINNNEINSAGLTFERLLGKKNDSLLFPDYKDIEIKCTNRFSRYPICLFSIAFEGPYVFETSTLLDKYGKEDYIFDKKRLILNLKYNYKVKYGKFYFELKIDESINELYINIYDLDHIFLEKRGIIYLDTIKDRIATKLNNLALVYASKKKENSTLYFRYYKIECYKYKNFNTFIDMIKKGEIICTLMLRFSKTMYDQGKNKNKGITFLIKKNKLNILFDQIYKYEK